MSGHSKWAQIKRQKEAADSKKGAVFTRLASAITVAAREGGKDPTSNFRLRLAIDKARASNMPKENIERAIRRGSGELGGNAIEGVTYEGYGPEGVAIVAETLTDNRNRTIAALRHVFTQYGGSLGGSNTVLWMFERRGILEIPSPSDRSAVELAAIDAGALDIVEQNGSIVVYTIPENLSAVRNALVRAGTTIENAEIVLVPRMTIAPSQQGRSKIQELLLALEESPDVIHVATNADI